jgi:hypothetical protein
MQMYADLKYGLSEGCVRLVGHYMVFTHRQPKCVRISMVND